MPRGSRNRRVRPSEVAVYTKRIFLPNVRRYYGRQYPGYSLYYDANLFPPTSRWAGAPPTLHIQNNDPVDVAIAYAAGGDRLRPQARIPLICPAHESRPGGDWETNSSGYEEVLCRRSNLPDTLKTPRPGAGTSTYYPIPRTGILFSEAVVVYRGPPEPYALLPSWSDLPVISVVPVSRPKLLPESSKYSFTWEIDDMRGKMRGALFVCLRHRYDRVVIGDFGLGKCLNPPRMMAEFWRDLFLFDADLRGQFRHVYFVFPSDSQNTTKQIADYTRRQDARRDHGSPPSATTAPTDMAIFQHVFSPGEIQRELHGRRDPRYEIRMITT